MRIVDVKKKVKERKDVFNILPFSQDYVRKFLIKMLFIKILLLCLNIIEPLLYQMMIDKVILLKEMERLIYICCGYILIQILSTIMDSFQFKEKQTFFTRLLYQLRVKLLHRSYDMNQTDWNAIELKNIIENDTEKNKKLFI